MVTGELRGEEKASGRSSFGRPDPGSISDLLTG